VHRNTPVSSTSGAATNPAPVTAAQDNTEATILPVICEESIEVKISPAIHEESVKIQIPPVNHDGSVMTTALAGSGEGDVCEDGWEEDLDECVGGDVRGWDVL
jgi:hypothetical protein